MPSPDDKVKSDGDFNIMVTLPDGQCVDLLTEEDTPISASMPKKNEDVSDAHQN
jgi:hypothetical protein